MGTFEKSQREAMGIHEEQPCISWLGWESALDLGSVDSRNILSKSFIMSLWTTENLRLIHGLENHFS